MFFRAVNIADISRIRVDFVVFIADCHGAACFDISNAVFYAINIAARSERGVFHCVSLNQGGIFGVGNVFSGRKSVSVISLVDVMLALVQSQRAAFKFLIRSVNFADNVVARVACSGFEGYFAEIISFSV